MADLLNQAIDSGSIIKLKGDVKRPGKKLSKVNAELTKVKADWAWNRESGAGFSEHEGDSRGGGEAQGFRELRN